jgi:hypothetical protein
MLLSATLVLLGFWLAIVWYCDIDGFRRKRCHQQRGAAKAAEREDRDAAAPNR